MPHIHLRGSEAIGEPALGAILEELVECLSNCETIQSEAIKAYWTHHPNFKMGKNAPNGFLHCEVAILAGRPDELRNRIADSMFGVLRNRFGNSALSLTLEVREMEKATYRK